MIDRCRAFAFLVRFISSLQLFDFVEKVLFRRTAVEQESIISILLLVDGFLRNALRSKGEQSSIFTREIRRRTGFFAANLDERDTHHPLPRMAYRIERSGEFRQRITDRQHGCTRRGRLEGQSQWHRSLILVPLPISARNLRFAFVSWAASGRRSVPLCPAAVYSMARRRCCSIERVD